MKKNLKTIILIMIFFAVLIYSKEVFAFTANMEFTEYSDEYKKYMSLSDEEKEQVLEPKRYDVISTKTNGQYLSEMQNIFRSASLLRNTLSPSYTLLDYIPENLSIKNQATTNSCWAFATIASIESNLALQDYKAGRQSVIYDYSERHMTYSSRRSVFNDGEINKYGISLPLSKGGNFFIGQTYLSNGMGAINEDEMVFEDNEDNIDISEIQNKNVTTTLYDTIWFEDINDIGKDELISKMKQTIATYGGIYASIHGAQITSDGYNNATGAIYCNDVDTYPSNHAVLIIGWIDDYSIENFNSNSQPENPGAWIIKNSWGELQEYDLLEIKQDFIEVYQTEMNELGWTSAEDIPDNFVQAFFQRIYGEDKVSINEGKLIIEIGDNGYMYVSYDDVNVYNILFGIGEITNTKDYDNIYQHDELGAGVSLSFKEMDHIYIANKFTRNDTDQNEVLDKISLFTMQEITCQVYVNSNSDDLTELQSVELQSGDTIVIEPGYHTIELKNPVKLTGDSFAVAIRMENSTEIQTVMAENMRYDENVEINENESFFTDDAGFESGEWLDWGLYSDEEYRCNVSIKAFTSNEEIIPQLEEIEITKEPNKLNYIEGEDFEKEGMIVLAKYSDLSQKEITDYEVLDGENLYYGQSEITISYMENEIEKTAKQAITVERINIEKEVESIEIIQLPTTTTYPLNSNELDLEGGIIEVKYTDDTTEEISMQSSDITVSGFNGVVLGKQTITVIYQGKSDTFEIEVLNDIEPELSNLENIVAKINNVNVYLYTNLDKEIYMDMQICVEQIADRDENTQYTYYYYISGNDSEENIENWTKIDSDATVQSDGSYLLEFNVNTLDMSNYDELEDAEVLYVYIREVAEAGSQSIEQVSVTNINVDNFSAQYYVDDVLVGDIEDVLNNNYNIVNPGNSQNGETDNTVAGGTLPQTGAVVTISIFIVILLGIGIYKYIRYRNIDK